MRVFEITMAGRRFSVTRELHTHNEFHQTYWVDGREVSVQRYLQLVAMAAPALSMNVAEAFVSRPAPVTNRPMQR
jgi:hypothetical protein